MTKETHKCKSTLDASCKPVSTPFSNNTTTKVAKWSNYIESMNICGWSETSCALIWFETCYRMCALRNYKNLCTHALYVVLRSTQILHVNNLLTIYFVEPSDIIRTHVYRDECRFNMLGTGRNVVCVEKVGKNRWLKIWSCNLATTLGYIRITHHLLCLTLRYFTYACLQGWMSVLYAWNG